MIVEKMETSYPIQDLIQSIWPLLEKNKSVQRSASIGGWALQSTNGSYEDGWSNQFCPYNGPGNMSPSWTPKSEADSQLKTVQDFHLPTEIQSEKLNELFSYLNHLGLHPRRARIIKLSKNSECAWHQDGSAKFYQVRLHIPLITNDGCFFETPEDRYHMAADGSFYFVHINRPHRVVNSGDQDRYHFVCHVWDEKQITNFHKYDPDKNIGES